MSVLIAFALLMLSAVSAYAAEPIVDNVVVRAETRGTFRFDVTVRHADTGWDHYANAFTISTIDGTVLGTRTLLHPYVNEQPFTRSLNGVAVPEGVSEVVVRAVDSVHGEGPTVRVPLAR